MDDIITEIDDFLAQHSMKPGTFGRLSVGDHHVVQQIRSGRDLRRSTERRIRAFMASYGTEGRAA